MRKLDPALIGFDIDGVVADTGGAFIRIAREEYGIDSISLDDITSFEVEECIDMDREIIETIFGRLLNDPLQAGLQPMANAIPVLHRIAAEAPLTFVTARPDEGPISRWLRHFLTPAAFSQARLVAIQGSLRLNRTQNVIFFQRTAGHRAIQISGPRHKNPDCQGVG